MSDMVLTDKSRFPTQEVIESHLGKTVTLWQSLFDHLHQAHPDFAERWKYYSDGKSWLLNVSWKKKTVFWLSVVDGGFRTTFYLTDKAGPAISKSELSEGLKAQFRAGKGRGTLRGLTILYRKRRDVEDAKRLIEIKTSVR